MGKARKFLGRSGETLSDVQTTTEDDAWYERTSANTRSSHNFGAARIQCTCSKPFFTKRSNKICRVRYSVIITAPPGEAYGSATRGI